MSTQPTGKVGFFRTASEIISRANLALRAGLTFHGNRDLYEALGYKRILQPQDYRARYNRGGIAKRIIEAFPKATWRGGAELVEDENPELSTQFEEAWTNLQQKFSLWSLFSRLDIVSGIGNFGVLLLGLPGEMDQPAEPVASPEDLLYLFPYSHEEIKVSQIVQDASDPRFGQPMYYMLTRKTALDSTAASSLASFNIQRKVHWTRTIHVADGVLDDPIFGTPRLEAVWNYVDDLEKIVGGGSEAFWQRVHQGYVYKIDPEAVIKPEDLTHMEQKAEEFANGMRRTIAVRGTEVNALGTDVSGFDKQVLSIISLISGTTGIPQRILLGSERGELASSQDKENWDTRVQDRRDDFAEPMIVRPFVKRMIQLGILPQPTEFRVQWPELENLPADEQAQVADLWAGLNAKMGDVVVTAADIRDKVLRLDPLEEAEPPEAGAVEPIPTDPTPDEHTRQQVDAPEPGQPDPGTQPQATQTNRRVAAPARPKASMSGLRRWLSTGRGSAGSHDSEGS